MERIPLITGRSSDVSLTANVGGVSVRMRLLYNEMTSSWFADFESVGGANYGVQLVPYSRLLGAANRVLTDGDFIVMKDETASPDGITYENIGTTWGLYYATGDDVKELAAAGVV